MFLLFRTIQCEFESDDLGLEYGRVFNICMQVKSFEKCQLRNSSANGKGFFSSESIEILNLILKLNFKVIGWVSLFSNSSENQK